MPARIPGVTRREFLRKSLAATSLFLPVPYAWVWAQSEGALKLLRAPKLALVVGNRDYKIAPLVTPLNDARSIATTLTSAGFDVAVKLDSTRADLSSAIQVFTQAVAKSKGIGLFYFAGHGLQLAWRNYIVPVDANIRSAADVTEQCVDLTTLLSALRRAANPLNVIILDACRDNPFGGLVGVDQRGLSQVDAPTSTLLAYATAPGNVASDGEGVNGLYTEYLLKEIVVPDAKVEDVFKRVRLQVRRRSNGKQIPWESTSLEDDFYFLPPKALSAQAAQAAQREREQESAAREKRRAQEEAARVREEETAAREAKAAAEEAERKRQQEIAALRKQRIAEEAERKRQQELAAQEQRRLAAEAERRRQDELAALEKQRLAEEVERKIKQEAALKEAQRVVEEGERKRREEQALREARLAEEEAERKHRLQMALQEKRRAEDEAQRKLNETQALLVAKQAEEAAERKSRADELALRDTKPAPGPNERTRIQLPEPPVQPSADQLQRPIEEELAVWEKVKTSTDRAALEEYLLRYPSGRFSELAQLKLDAVLAKQGEVKIAPISAPANPYTKGTARTNTTYREGDRYEYILLDVLTRLEQRRVTYRVREVTDDEVIYGNGTVTDLLGNYRVWGKQTWSSNQLMPIEFAVGKRWSTGFTHVTGQGVSAAVSLDLRIADRETIVLPAGTFNAFRIEAMGWRVGSNFNVLWNWKIWYAPDEVRRPVAWEWFNRNARGRIMNTNRAELASFRQS